MTDASAVAQSTAGRPPQTVAGPAAPPAPSRGAAPPGPPPQRGGSERFIVRAAAVTAAFTAAGALLGLGRDQLVAGLFGADQETDSFLVAWTVPEIAATLLIEDAMALVMIPAFSLALSRRAARMAVARVPEAPDVAMSAGAGVERDRTSGADPVGRLVASTAPRLCIALTCVAGLLALAAPQFVRLFAPGLPDPALAVDCTRLTAVTVLTFGIAGYFSAALRAHRCFLPPAAIYVAYNVGIIATVLLMHTLWGVRAAAAGVAVGGLLMVLVQAPAFLRQVPVRLRNRRAARTGRAPAAARTGRAPVETAPAAGSRTGGDEPEQDRRAAARRALPPVLAVLAPVALFALGRQSQVLVERYLGSSLPSGAISHLNYAQKVAQVPMTLSLMVVTVTFPLVARAMADGDKDRARRRVERDITLAALLVLLGAAYVIAYAPQLIQLLFQRGAFEASDTAATASVMRVYALGLLGHSLTGALIRPFFSMARPTWDPAAAMAIGLLVTISCAHAAIVPWGVHGIAAANAAGITVTMLLLLFGLGRQGIDIDIRRVTGGLARLALAAAAAVAAGWAVAPLVPTALGTVAAGALVVPAAFTAAAFAVRAPEVPLLISSAKRKLRRHAR
ncbi:lipid II flippase MurJ [Streptomyces sp. NPDC047108]|uniref:murein biosynthesis integral membrane protein MurJ n=1 Tax=Streptomyces sp. NPDC047108 TaxID=3155025 RepID=UPI0033E1F386